MILNSKNKDIEIIHEDSDIVVINKPAGLLVHKTNVSGNEFTLSDWVAENYPNTIDVGEVMHTDQGERILRPGIVHRLDKDTSGVMVIAKHQVAFEKLKKQFKRKAVRKTYAAFIVGHLKNERGIFDGSIGRNKKDFRKFSVSKTRGEVKEARTEYKVIKKLEDTSFVEFYPMTGRTHQIRAHTSSAKRPIVCDTKYGGRCDLGFERMALHSKRIYFKHPRDGFVEYESEYPKDFLSAMKESKILEI